MWLIVSVIIVLADQISKWLVVEHVIHPALYGENGSSFFQWYSNPLQITQNVAIHITSFFNIVMAWNTGVSFSMFSQIGDWGPYILTAIALGITLIFCYWLMRTKHTVYAFGYALVIGGAIGNIIDRLRFGAVIDFLDIHAYGYHWPAFNVADCAVVTGIGLLIIVSLSFDLNIKGRYRSLRKTK
ncbi:MAG: signal peptidase II [Alphaproteobacteria bacterium]|nr:signal peptidase II [Alphaproteobacteria bacterium]